MSGRAQDRGAPGSDGVDAQAVQPGLVSVVIPFYQDRPGVLADALRSVFRQALPTHLQVEVIVVDDCSPVAPGLDLAGLPAEDAARVRIISQENAGPAAARNTGLDAVGPESHYLAFLDSDDRWHDDHLHDALEALEAGHDAYFANNWVEAGQDWFSAHPRFAAISGTGPDGITGMLTLGTDQAVDLLIEEPLIHLSTLVLPFARHGALRFDRSLETGEDHLYTLMLADNSRALAANRAPKMTRGSDGVNFYRGALDWNSPKSTWRALTTVMKYRRISQLMAHRATIVRLADAKARVGLEELVYLLMRNGARYPRANLKVAATAWRTWGWKVIAAVPIAGSLLVRRRKGALDFRT